MFVWSPICHYVTVKCCGQIAALLAVDSGEENHGVLSEVTCDTNIYNYAFLMSNLLMAGIDAHNLVMWS